MNEKLEKIKEYFIKEGIKKERIEYSLTSSVWLATMIMEYAHRGQKRENGEDYAEHPARVVDYYRRLVGIDLTVPFGDIDIDLMYKYQIPYHGVQEVCLLHDVIEDTEFTMDDIRDIYIACGFEKYFALHIEYPLKLITHDKSMSYDKYVALCLKHPTAAIVKMMDLQDNLTVVDLIKLGEKEYQRASGYLSYIYLINETYHFLEGAKEYKDEFAKSEKMTIDDLKKLCDEVEFVHVP